MGPVRKRRPQSGGLSSADKEGGVLQMRTSAFFGVKISDFSKFMVCPYAKGEGG